MKRIFASRRTRWAAIVILIVLPAMLAAYSVFEFRRPVGTDTGAYKIAAIIVVICTQEITLQSDLVLTATVATQ